jgi:hypothetical protein
VQEYISSSLVTKTLLKTVLHMLLGNMHALHICKQTAAQTDPNTKGHFRVQGSMAPVAPLGRVE